MRKMSTGFRRYILGAVVAFAAAFLFNTFGVADVAHAAGEKYSRDDSKGPTNTITATGGVYGNNVVKFQPAPGRPASTIYNTQTFLHKVEGLRFPYSDCWYWVAITISGTTIHVGTIGVTIPGVKDNIEGIQLDPDDRQRYMDSCNKRATNDPGPGNPAYIGMDRTATLTVYTSTNPPPAPPPAPGSGTQEDAACSGGVLGWIICPLVQGLVGANNLIVGIMEDLLVLKPLSFDANNPLYIVWSLIRNIANFLFVLFFLVIIFSQATSMGLSNYGIKSILPRLVAAAILVNISYFIFAIAIDVTNILGSGVASIVDIGIRAIPNKDEWSTGAEIGMAAFYGSATAAIIVLLTTPLGPAIGLAMLGFLLAALAAVATGFVIITARHLIITVAVAGSALIALRLLFGDKEVLKMVKGIVVLLALGIVMPGIFHMAIFVAKFVAVQGVGNDDGTWVTPVVVIIILAAPAGAMPLVIKLIGGVGARFGAWTDNKGKGIVDRVSGKRKEAMNLGKGEIAANYDPSARGVGKLMNAGRRVATGTVGGITPRSRARANFTRSRMGNTYENDEIKLATDQLEQLGIMGDKDELRNFVDKSKNKYAKLAAMKQIAEIGGSSHLQKMFDNTSDLPTRKLAAKAIAGSSKMRTEANPLFFEASGYINNIQQGKTESEATDSGKTLRNNKIVENMSAQFLVTQKPDQIENIKQYIDKEMTGAQKTNAVVAFESAIDKLNASPSTVSRLSNESRNKINDAISTLAPSKPHI